MMILAPFRHVIGSRVAATLRRPDAGGGSNAVASGGTLTTDTPTLVEHTFTAGDTFHLSNKGLLPVTYTITGTATFGGASVSGSTNVVADVAVTVTSGSVVVSYDPTLWERGHPLGYSTLEFFIDGGLSTITHSSGAVSQWDDLSTNANHLVQATATNKPTTGTVTQNGINVIDFDGTNDWMEGGSFNVDVSGKALTIFTVHKWDATGTGKNVVGGMRSGQTVGLNTFMLEHNGSAQVVYGNGAAGYNAANFRERTFSNPGTAAFHRYVITIETTNGPKVWVDGASQSLSNGAGGGTLNPANFLASDSTAWKPYVGRRPDPFYFDGKLATYGIISEVLDTTERGALDSWLSTRWGV